MEAVLNLSADDDFVAGTGGFVDSVKYLHEGNAVFRRRDALAFSEAAIDEVGYFTVEESVEGEGGVAEGFDVDEHTVHIGKEFDLRVEFYAGFGAEELDIAAVLFEVKVKGRLDGEGETVIEADHRGGEILDVVGEGMALCGGDPALSAAGAVVAEIIIGNAVDRDGLRRAGEIANEVDHVDAEVDKRAAAGISFIAEPAARAAASSKISRFGVVDVAHRAAFDEFFDYIGVVAEAADETEHKKVAGGFGEVVHLLGFSGGERHGFFAEDFAARFKSGNGGAFMGSVPRADRDGIDLFAFEHLVVIRIEMGYTVFCGVFGDFFFVEVAYGDDFAKLGKSFIALHMTVTDAAASDDGDS